MRHIAIAILAATTLIACETTTQVKEVAADRAAKIVRDYCLLTPALRAEKRAEFQERLDREAGPGHALTITCPADG